MIVHETKIFQLKEKIVRLENDLLKLKAELNYWERQKALAMQEKIRGGGRPCSGKQ